MKRLVDMVCVVLTFPFLAPVLVLLGFGVWWALGWPILFCQRRPGRAGRIFNLWKFRTMTDVRDGHGNLLPDAERLTRFGRWLRSTSLDELPEIFNVLKGDMSLVGPRPLLVQYLDRYTPEQRRRHEVRPGITGWAQINGRNALSWEEKFRLDVWYVDHQSLWLDLRILGRTIWSVLGRTGINAAGGAMMPEFMGSESDVRAADGSGGGGVLRPAGGPTVPVLGGGYEAAGVHPEAH